MVISTIFAYLSLSKQQQDYPVPTIQGKILRTPISLSNFELVDQNNFAFRNQHLLNSWHLISYGYLNCADICPTTLMVLKQLKEQIRGSLIDANVVFYSVDAKRDRPDKLKNYLAYFDAEFIGLTATNDNSNSSNLARSLGIKSTINTVTNNNGQTELQVSHGVSLFLINPEGQLQAVLKPNQKLASNIYSFEPAQLKRDIELSIKHYQSVN
ncbi:SCO family protein [Thalassotalea sp. ND16A]|uniref:SCO family protein n=1 Tax=Thalassotalea sp. ND16A TaxID=1535422 RepID=UPI000ACDB83D|nr:SCO family protein [Thalassotalea sp. ND16A]